MERRSGLTFLDLWFWGFVGVALPGYWLCPRRVKLLWLVATSAVFHWHFAGPVGVAVIAVLAVLTWSLGLALRRPSGARLFAVGLVVLIGALVLFKYAAFFFDAGFDVAKALSIVAPDVESGFEQPVAPLAISFFTFLFIHYLFEIRVRGREPVRSPLRFALFAIYFPTLAAGPLKRFQDFVPQLDELSNPGLEDVREGAARVVRGLFKKVCVADLIAEAVGVLEETTRYTAPLVVVLAVLQGWRIYYDFAGYTDVAIGLSRMLGLRVPENFHKPFGATSFGEFWRRWHMSLSFWIRDYVFLPLGGSFVFAMALCGLWHGAAWNFLLWGLFHGVGLSVEARVRRRFPWLFQRGRLPTATRRAIFLSLLSYSWLLFFYPPATVWAMTLGSVRWLLGID